MDGIVSWFIYSLPWQLQATLVIAIAAGLLVLIGIVFGWEVVKKIWPAIVGIAGVLVFWNKSKQEGYNVRKDEEEKARDEASDFAADLRGDVQKLPPNKLDERVSRWEKD